MIVPMTKEELTERRLDAQHMIDIDGIGCYPGSVEAAEDEITLLDEIARLQAVIDSTLTPQDNL